MTMSREQVIDILFPHQARPAVTERERELDPKSQHRTVKRRFRSVVVRDQAIEAEQVVDILIEHKLETCRQATQEGIEQPLRAEIAEIVIRLVLSPCRADLLQLARQIKVKMGRAMYESFALMHRHQDRYIAEWLVELTTERRRARRLHLLGLGWTPIEVAKWELEHP